ncbi:MAG: hypothetical protein AB2693_32835 [Candidatus Thiodiazotropha sp.]
MTRIVCRMTLLKHRKNISHHKGTEIGGMETEIASFKIVKTDRGIGNLAGRKVRVLTRGKACQVIWKETLRVTVQTKENSTGIAQEDVTEIMIETVLEIEEGEIEIGTETGIANVIEIGIEIATGRADLIGPEIDLETDLENVIEAVDGVGTGMMIIPGVIDAEILIEEAVLRQVMVEANLKSVPCLL